MNNLESSILFNVYAEQRKLHQFQLKALGKEWMEFEPYHFSESAAFEQAILNFIGCLEIDRTSNNPFNSRSSINELIQGHRIIEKNCWTNYRAFSDVFGDVQLSRARAEVKDDFELIMVQASLTILRVAPPHRFPLILDRQGRVIDGLQRLHALKWLQVWPFCTVCLDYEHRKEMPYI
jgi:hypothetical protein